MKKIVTICISPFLGVLSACICANTHVDTGASNYASETVRQEEIGTVIQEDSKTDAQAQSAQETDARRIPDMKCLVITLLMPGNKPRECSRNLRQQR